MDSSGGKIVVWYWFLAGDKFMPDFYRQQAHIALNALRGNKIQGALIRVSVVGDSPNLEKKAKSFIKDQFMILFGCFLRPCLWVSGVSDKLLKFGYLAFEF